MGEVAGVMDWLVADASDYVAGAQSSFVGAAAFLD